MKLYEDIQDTKDFTLAGGETVRLRFRHDGYDVMIATENTTEDPDACAKAAGIPEGTREELLKKGEEASEACKAVDEEIRALLKERSEKVREFMTLSRAVKLMDAAEEAQGAECYDWREPAEKLNHAGDEAVIAHFEKQNKVYHAEVTAFHEPMGPQFRMSFKVMPAAGILYDGYQIAHKTKIPDYKSKEEAHALIDEMMAQLDREFFPEENPEIPRRYRRKLMVEGLPIPGYRYEE